MNNRAVGTAYEEAAATRLASMGYRILEHSFRCREGEIDLVARDGACLVFVEVKYRRTGCMGHPLEAVTPAKQRRICRVSDVYRMRHRIPSDMQVRYDVAAVLDQDIQVVQNAFPYRGRGF